MNPLLKNLSSHLARADEIEAREKKIRERRASLHQSREAIFAEPNPDDGKALAELTKFGAEDHLLALQQEQCQREKKGLDPSILNEVNFVRSAVGKRVAAVRSKLLAELDASLADHYPEPNDRARIMARPPRPPAVVMLESHLAGLDCLFNPRDQTGLDFGRQFLGIAERALEAIGERRNNPAANTN